MPRRARLAAPLFVFFIFAFSLMPSALTLGEAVNIWKSDKPMSAAMPSSLRPFFSELENWYAGHVEAVEELRPLVSLPANWIGRWFDIDKNYTAFSKWFADHVGMRNLMIRGKNELDYRLFNSSSRVYFGKDNELYGRNLMDNELPATEAVLATPAQRDSVYRGLLAFSGQLRDEGITMILIAPVEKQYFTRDHLPFFAPRLPDDSNFMKLYRRLQTTPSLHFIDAYGLQKAQQGHIPIFYHQDFHWTDPVAMLIAAESVRMIAVMENSTLRWRHPLEYDLRPFDGVEARFSARLNGHQDLPEPVLRKSWTDVHQTIPHDPASSGLEFETDSVTGEHLLPSTCLYGNSFSDGMLRAGLTDHFEKVTKIGRLVALPKVPALVKGRCSYLIMQVLDIQPYHWKSLAE